VYLPSEIQKGDPMPATLELGKWGVDSTRALRRYLNRRWKETEAVFPSRSSPRLTPRSLRRRVKRLAEIADVHPQLAEGGTGEPEDVSPHTLRHSVAYRIIQVEGGRLEDVQLRLRHANLATTDQIYAHLVPR
jgi:integrase